MGGLFKEFPSNLDSDLNSDPEVRFFERHYVIVPAGSGFCIRNEMIFVNSATVTQVRSFLKPLPTISAPPTTINNTVTFPNTTLNSAAGATFNNNNNNTAMQSNVNVTGISSSLQSRLQLQQPSSATIAPNVASLMSPNPTQFPAQAATTQTPIAANANVSNNDAAKVQLVQALSAQTNMNLDWSRKYVKVYYFRKNYI